MKLAASSIAWDPADDAKVVDVLRRNGITGVELVPTKWRDDPYSAPIRDIRALHARWRDAGFQVVALQSLLFGHPELLLFGDQSSRDALNDYLRRAINFGAQLLVNVLVFGSPKNRWRGDLAPDDALKIAAEFFTDLAEYAQSHGCAICIEPNPPAYGADFITTTRDAIALCELVDNPAGFRVNVDVGALAINAEDPHSAIAAAAPFIGHVHASAPSLVELSDDRFQRGAAAALRSVGYDRWVSVEMRPHPTDPVAAVDRASSLVERIYG